ncbi:SdpI family protein [Kytococcus sedentarius]|uniref:SdpI family protein n=1 Tax=Kytococcus sedentarius TaxID=1276 RepID=UPI0009D6B4DE|nr:SdpI family protein [Kytococcus sedentarius]QQB64434.1 SdpI family protein [Kytococcus sedentarius]
MSTSEVTLLAVVLTALSIVGALIVASCARGSIGPNNLIGLRIGNALNSEEDWRRVHRAALFPIAAGAALILLITVMLLVDTTTSGAPSLMSAQAYANSSIAVLILSVVIGSVAGLVAGRD